MPKTSTTNILKFHVGAHPPENSRSSCRWEKDLLALKSLPIAHRRQIWSTNPLERLNQKIKCRTDIVGVFLNPEALLRFTIAVLIEQHVQWVSSSRRYLSKTSMTILTGPEELDEEVIRQLDIALPYRPRPKHGHGNYTSLRDALD